MSNGQVLNLAAKNFAEQYGGARKALREMQPSPMGTVPRSDRSAKALWRKMRALPPDQFDAVMNAAAQKSGHENDEKDLCEVCRFVTTQAGSE